MSWVDDQVSQIWTSLDHNLQLLLALTWPEWLDPVDCHRWTPDKLTLAGLCLQNFDTQVVGLKQVLRQNASLVAFWGSNVVWSVLGLQGHDLELCSPQHQHVRLALNSELKGAQRLPLMVYAALGDQQPTKVNSTRRLFASMVMDWLVYQRGEQSPGPVVLLNQIFEGAIRYLTLPQLQMLRLPWTLAERWKRFGWVCSEAHYPEVVDYLERHLGTTLSHNHGRFAFPPWLDKTDVEAAPLVAAQWDVGVPPEAQPCPGQPSLPSPGKWRVMRDGNVYEGCFTPDQLRTFVGNPNRQPWHSNRETRWLQAIVQENQSLIEAIWDSGALCSEWSVFIGMMLLSPKLHDTVVRQLGDGRLTPAQQVQQIRRAYDVDFVPALATYNEVLRHNQLQRHYLWRAGILPRFPELLDYSASLCHLDGFTWQIPQDLWVVACRAKSAEEAERCRDIRRLPEWWFGAAARRGHCMPFTLHALTPDHLEFLLNHVLPRAPTHLRPGTNTMHELRQAENTVLGVQDLLFECIDRNWLSHVQVLWRHLTRLGLAYSRQAGNTPNTPTVCLTRLLGRMVNRATKSQAVDVLTWAKQGCRLATPTQQK